MNNTKLKDLTQRLTQNINKVIVGKNETIQRLIIALICGGHVLLEDVPGTAKTLLAKTLSKSLDLNFSRVQFTPDLLPSDVTGIHYYDQKQGEFVFREGPVFTNILLADEINRATPRTRKDRFLLTGRHILLKNPLWLSPPRILLKLSVHFRCRKLNWTDSC
jgi:MoxR-like ATPase